MSEPTLVLEDFILGSLLGTGHRSEVRLGERGTEKFAFKCLKKTGIPLYDNKSYFEYVNEINILSNLCHPNIITLKTYGESVMFDTDTCEKIPTLYLVFEYAEGGNLSRFIKSTGKLSNQLARYYFKQILDALSYIHYSGFVHRDIKPENILLDKSLNIYLADFDLSDVAAGLKKGRVGTYGYMAPEVEMGSLYCGIKADIFSLGVTLFYMVTGRYPFNGTYQNIHYDVFCNHITAFWNIFETAKDGEKYCSEFKDLMNTMLAKDPTKRPTVEDIKHHPWVKGPEISELELAFEKMIRRQDIGL